jgi:2-oxoglutarate ferredoxin oxidoreductase subunit beta
VGQAYAGHQHHLADMIKQAIAHRGFSYLHILSPCVTFDKTNMTYQNMSMAVRPLPEDHDTSSQMAAMREATKTDAPGLGVLFREDRPTLGDNLDAIARSAGADIKPGTAQAAE